jgi:hypothetical protein
MLTVYTYPIPRPADVIDLSTLPLDSLVDSAVAVLTHQKTAKIWFGYLDGWMLTPHEEVRLRAVIRAFPCVVVSRFPLSFSLAWKNEMDSIYTPISHGDANSHNDGGSVHDGSSLGHNETRS